MQVECNDAVFLPQVAQAHYERSTDINLFHFAYIMTLAKYKSLGYLCSYQATAWWDSHKKLKWHIKSNVK